jgi:hypothetical protein
MKHTPVLLLTLVAASGSAAVGAASGLNYNRAELSYSTNDSLKGWSLGATAELAGTGVLVSGVYSDVTGKGDLAGFGGYETGFGLGYKFNVGPGDLVVGVNYLQGQFGASNGVAIGEQKSLGLQYRQAVGGSFEFTAGYQRVRTNLGALAVVGGLVVADAASVNGNVFNLGARYNLTKNFDLSLSYAFQSKDVGGNTLGLSAGYSF